MRTGTLDIKTVCDCNRCLGCKTLHPQVCLINLENQRLKHEAVRFEFYAILLIEECGDACCCGRKYYDFTNTTMVFLQPDEVFRMNEVGALPDKGWLLAFHPDLLYCTSLKNHIRNYTFFAYHKEEALHLSQRETNTIICCLENIETELHHSIDTHTATILTRHIELLLDYCTRFYERQFITREYMNHTIIRGLEAILDDCVISGRLQGGKLPTSEYCADLLHTSVSYFNDLLKFETGKTLEEYLLFKRLKLAQRMLLESGNSPYDVARLLGFPNVRCFSLLFKKMTGVAPNDYRSCRVLARS